MLSPHGAIVAVVEGRNLKRDRHGGAEAAPDLTPMAAPRPGDHTKDFGGRQDSDAANPAGHPFAEDAHAAIVAVWLDEQVPGQKIGRSRYRRSAAHSG